MTDYERLWRDEKARREELEEELLQFRAIPDSDENIPPVRLTPAHQLLLERLLSARPTTVVTHETLWDDMQTSDRAWGRESTNIKLTHVQVCKLRKVLEPIDVHIETVWGRGYRLPQASRDAWQRAVDKHRAALETA